MSLTACRECQQQVSTEAAACPHCGAGRPTGAPGAAAPEPPLFPSTGKSGKYWWGIVSAVVVALVVAFGGYHLWQSQQGIVVSGPELEQKIVDQYRPLAGNDVALTAKCPLTPRMHKDRIVDCSVERSDTGASSPVFVTPTDDSGHFQMQLEDASALTTP